MSGAGERVLVREWWEVRWWWGGNASNTTTWDSNTREVALANVANRRAVGYLASLVHVRRYRIERQKGAGHG